MADQKAKHASFAEHVQRAINFNPLPATGYIRLSQLIGNVDADPPIPPIIPVGKSSIWAWIKAGRFPAPVKLGARVTAWRAEDVRAWIAARG